MCGGPKKKMKLSSNKHYYPSIPHNADDDESHKRSMQRLEDELAKPKPTPEVIKSLLARTFPWRRSKLLNGEISISSIFQDIKVLKKCSYVRK